MRAEDLARELRLLKRGEGLYAADLSRSVGPGLRAAFGLHPDEDPELTRAKLRNGLMPLVDLLEQPEGLAVSASLGMHEGAPFRFLKERQNFVVKHLDRDSVRTADRLANRGLRRIANMIVANGPRSGSSTDALAFVGDGWYVLSASLLVLADRTPNVVQERRTIISAASGLNEVSDVFEAPTSDEDSDAESWKAVPLFGGMIAESTWWSGRICRTRLQLPQPLSVGEQYEYAISFEGPAAGGRRVFVHTPLRRCDSLSIRLRVPSDVGGAWMIAGMPPSIASDVSLEMQHPVRPNAAGEVLVDFTDIYLGLAYGIGWSV